MRWLRSGAAVQAASQSGAVAARHCRGSWLGRPALLPRSLKINFAALLAAFSSSPPGRCGSRPEALVREGFPPSAGAGPWRHGRHGAGAGRRAVRPAGGAARPRRSLLRGCVLLQGERRTAALFGEAKGRVQVPRRPGPLGFAFPSSCSVALFRRGEASGAPATVGRLGRGLGAATSLVTVLNGQCPPWSYLQ